MSLPSIYHQQMSHLEREDVTKENCAEILIILHIQTKKQFQIYMQNLPSKVLC